MKIVKSAHVGALGGLGRGRTPEWIIASLLILLEVSLIVLSLSLYKGLTNNSRTIVGGVAGLLGVLLPALYLARLYIKSVAAERRLFSMVVGMNLVTVCVVGLAGEVVVRVSATPNDQGVEVFGTTLLPKDWQAVTVWNRRLLKEVPQSISYLTADNLLGWTIAPNRVSKNGLYTSSQEGIRSPTVGMSYREPSQPNRMAIVGDSFTFALGVPFQSSWGAQLEDRLADKVEVLNFGVDAYGIDQAYLRYHRDVKPLRPNIVMLGFIEHDLFRTMNVYPFIGHPAFWQRPFAKPRFAILHEKLELLNSPLITPGDLFALPTVTSLPFIEYEPGYAAEEWQWRWYHHSALVRYVVSRFPRWPDPSSLVSEAATAAIDVEILLRFVREVEAEGAIPLLVYLPGRGDFIGWERRGRDFVFQSLQGKHVPYVDLGPCMKQGETSMLFLEGDPHYSPEGNARLADCLTPIVQERLGSRGAGARARLEQGL